MDYTRSAATALRLLTKYGQDVSLKRAVDSIPDLTTGIVTQSAPIVVAAKGVLLDFIYRTFGNESEKGKMVQASDKRLLMSAGTEPSVRDTIIVNGDEFHIVNIKQVNPAGTAVLYDIWLRK